MAANVLAGRAARPLGLRQCFQLDTFFETGCYQGESMLLAYAAGFQKVISCDIQ